MGNLVAVVGVHRSAEVDIPVAMDRMGCDLARPESEIDRLDQPRMVAEAVGVPDTVGTAAASEKRVGMFELVVLLSEAGLIEYYW